MRTRLDAAREQHDRLREARDESWPEMKAAADQAWSEVEEAYVDFEREVAKA